MPGRPDRALVSMGIYVFLTEYLAHQLRQDAADENSSRDFGKNVIPRLLKQGYHVQAYYYGKSSGEPHYWRDVGTVDAYFNANLELVSANAELDLFNPRWPILSYQPQLPPARMIGGQCSRVASSIVGNGAIVESSAISNSVISGNVRVHSGCVLDRIVALPGCEVRRGSRLRNVILDSRCVVPEGTVIGENPEEDRNRFEVTADGNVVVTRQMLGQSASYHPGLVSGG